MNDSFSAYQQFGSRVPYISQVHKLDIVNKRLLLCECKLLIHISVCNALISNCVVYHQTLGSVLYNSCVGICMSIDDRDVLGSFWSIYVNRGVDVSCISDLDYCLFSLVDNLGFDDCIFVTVWEGNVKKLERFYVCVDCFQRFSKLSRHHVTYNCSVLPVLWCHVLSCFLQNCVSCDLFVE